MTGGAQGKAREEATGDRKPGLCGQTLNVPTAFFSQNRKQSLRLEPGHTLVTLSPPPPLGGGEGAGGTANGLCVVL